MAADSHSPVKEPPVGFFRRLSLRIKPRQPSTIAPMAPPTPKESQSRRDSVISDSGSPEGKDWAQRYLLDPLTAPEPSQETGPGSSFINPARSQSVRIKAKQPDTGYPTPPTSASPSRQEFHPTNPFSDRYQSGSPSRNQRFQDQKHREDEDKLLSLLSDDLRALNTAPNRASTLPFGPAGDSRKPEGESSRASNAIRPARGPYRSSTVRHSRYPPITEYASGSRVSRSQSLNSQQASGGLRRNGSLSARYPGDMSHRPLDQIKRETRAADRAPHLRKRGMTGPDTIDSLDDTGLGIYHHDGPYDATLAARNQNKLYSPVEAVRETNMKALKATPHDYIQDSLRKHVPLQGVASIPPGMEDLAGRRMSYEEGADLMREPDAPGGAYRRYDDINYHPDDLKGKGEPSFSLERALNEQKRLDKQSASNGNAQSFEMQPTNTSRKNGGVMIRERSTSQAAQTERPTHFATGDADIRRSNTTGKRLSDGIKRRFNSVRRKHEVDV